MYFKHNSHEKKRNKEVTWPGVDDFLVVVVSLWCGGSRWRLVMLVWRWRSYNEDSWLKLLGGKKYSDGDDIVCVKKSDGFVYVCWGFSFVEKCKEKRCLALVFPLVWCKGRVVSFSLFLSLFFPLICFDFSLPPLFHGCPKVGI